jgi:outer membrane protein, heavy metal efflux system
MSARRGKQPALRLSLVLAAVFGQSVLGSSQSAAEEVELPDPLRLVDVTRFARENRDEIAAARARAAAAGERPISVSALEDPMVSLSLDHYPFDMMDDMGLNGRYDWSYSVEQRFPFSGVRGHRRRAAEAEAARLRAEADRTTLEIELDATSAFLMLQERRQMAGVAQEQLTLSRQLTAAAAARYATGQTSQSDLLRAEVEAARAEAQLYAIEAEIRSAEAMLNASLGRDVPSPVPPLASVPRDAAPPTAAEAVDMALYNRPELREGAAEIDRADAEADVMRSMYRPMGMVRVGRASTMVEGDGFMLMVGVSLPIWRTSLRAGVREADAMQRMARADLAAMRRMVEGEVVAAREQIDAMRVMFRALRDDVVPRAQSAVQSALAAYQSGQSDMVAVVESMRALWSIQAELVMAEVELGLAWARLDRATGGMDATR